MIEFSRYARCKPQGLVKAVLDGDGIFVDFKMFDPENGKERPEPERSRLTFQEIEREIDKLELGLSILKEFIKLKPQEK